MKISGWLLKGRLVYYIVWVVFKCGSSYLVYYGRRLVNIHVPNFGYYINNKLTDHYVCSV